jgi:sugar lactone lactonase YvrE
MERKIHPGLEVTVKYPCTLGEGSLWDSKRNAICWVDILKCEIHEFKLSESVHRIYPVNEMVGTIALCNNGDFIAALKNGIARVNRIDGSIRTLVHPESHLPNNRYNDGKCDPAGRLWVGSISLTEEQGAASLYMINPDLSVSKKIPNVTISNGLAWTSDYKTFYYIDTPTLTVVAYDFDLTTGNITNKRIVINVPKEEGFPDGMTIDTEGMLWIAHWEGWQAARWNPFTGRKIASISVPVARVSSCTFGGKNLDDLYITTARVGLTQAQVEEQPLAGSLFVLKQCGSRGALTFEFDDGHVNSSEI